MGSESTWVVALSLTRDASGFQVTATGPLGQASRHVAHEQEALLDGSISECLNLHRLKARQAGAMVRLSLRTEPGASADMWAEALRDPVSGQDLGLATDMTIARHEDRWRPARPLDFAAELRLLIVAPEPGDIEKSGGDAAAAALEQELAWLAAGGKGRVQRLKPATEKSLDELLRTAPWDVVHFIGQGASRPAARYGTLTLLGSDGRSRPVNAQNVARMIMRSPSLRLVVLQAVSRRKPGEDFAVVTQALLDAGVPAVVWLPDCSPGINTAVTGELYRRVATGEPVDLAVADVHRAIAARVPDSTRRPGPVLFASESALQLPQRPTATQPAPAIVQGAPDVADDSRAAQQAEQHQRVRQLLERRRAAGEFDVFLCHNVADKPAVRDLGLRLRERGILPWLDEWELQPGMPWQRLLEQQIGRIRSAVVFVGREGIGPWQRQELDGFLREFANRKCPVIPALLPGAPEKPGLPLFLEGMTWVDFRIRDPDPMVRLIWGITGQRPQIE